MKSHRITDRKVAHGRARQYVMQLEKSMFETIDAVSKPGARSSIELLMVQAHSQQGYDILKGIDFP